jgi:hypothetical protein
MTDEPHAVEASVLDEGAWVYLVSFVPDGDGANLLRECVVEACEAGGWPVVSEPAPGAPAPGDPGQRFESVRHAVEHADCVVALIGETTETADAELALAYSHRRPIVGLRFEGTDSSASAVQEMLNSYDRARVLACDGPDECGVKLRAVFADHDFAETIRMAAGEHAGDV